MADYKSAFLREMDRKGIRYLSLGEWMVRVSYTGENLKTIPIIVLFDTDGDNEAQFSCVEVAGFKEDKRYAAALMACNKLNDHYSWAKFYLDDDRDIRVEADAIFSMDNVGEVCIGMVQRMVQIIDEAYLELKKI